MEAVMQWQFGWKDIGRSAWRFCDSRITKASFIAVLSASMILSGCSFAGFAAAAEADLPVAMQIVTTITNIVAPGVSGAIQTAGGLALAALQIVCGMPAPGATKCDPTSLLGQYQAATDPSIKTSLLEKIRIALAAANAHIADILALAKGLSPAIAAAIIGGISVALQVITMLIGLIHGTAATATTAQRDSAHLLLKNIPSPAQMKARYNASVSGQFPQAVIH